MPNNTDNRIYTDLDYYAILEITQQATPAEIRSNYIRLARLFHPDKIGANVTEDDNERFRKVQTAFEILKDPDTRILYDLNRSSQHRATGITHEATTRMSNPIASRADNDLLMSQISKAVLSKNIKRLKELLAEYNKLKFASLYGTDNIKEFNWLLRTAAFEHANEVAKLLIEFGADPNHYGPIIRKDNSDILECYFTEILVYCGNKELFTDLVHVFDFENFVVTLQPFDNINNLKVNLNNLAYEQFNEYERNLSNEQDKVAARLFILNLKTRLFMLSMLCHWAIENGCEQVLQRIKDISHPKDRWHGFSPLGFSNSDAAEDCVRSCMLFHRYNSIYVIEKFERTVNQSRIYLFKYYLQYLVDRLLLNSTLLISKDSNVKYLEEIVRRFSILLEADKIDASGLIHRIEWQKRHHYKFCALFTGSYVLGIILSLVTSSLDKNNNAKGPLGISSLILLAPFGVLVVIPVVLLLLRPLTCGLYDVYLTLDEVMLSAYTNLLLADRLKSATARVTTSIPEPSSVPTTQSSCITKACGLFFCYGSKKESSEQEVDPESQIHERLLLRS